MMVSFIFQERTELKIINKGTPMEAQILEVANTAKDEAHSAKFMAAEANHKIDSYIKVNTVQHENLTKQITRLGENEEKIWKALEKTNNRILYAAGASILILLGALGATTAMILERIQ